MTQPGASKHLRVLREVGLVRDRKAGKQRVYGLDARGLQAPVHEWSGGFEQFWNESFDRLDALRAGPRSRRSGGRVDERDGTRSAGAVRDGRPRDRDLPGHRRPTGVGVRGVHRGPAPVAVVGTGGVHHHHTRAFEFPGREAWDFVMHGPDGTDFQEWISWTEIDAPTRIALLHGESHDDPNTFESVLTFADGAQRHGSRCARCFPPRSSTTRRSRSTTRSRAARQTLNNLAAYVAEIVSKGSW